MKAADLWVPPKRIALGDPLGDWEGRQHHNYPGKYAFLILDLRWISLKSKWWEIFLSGPFQELSRLVDETPIQGMLAYLNYPKYYKLKPGSSRRHWRVAIEPEYLVGPSPALLFTGVTPKVSPPFLTTYLGPPSLGIAREWAKEVDFYRRKSGIS